MVDRAAKRAEGKGIGYDRWAAVHNLKQLAASFNFLNDNGLLDMDKLDAAVHEKYQAMREARDSLRPLDDGIAEKKELRKLVSDYWRTRPTVDVGRKLKGSRAEKHRRAYEAEYIIHEVTLRQLRERVPGKTLPSVKTLNAEIEALVSRKNALYNDYRAAKREYEAIANARCNASELVRSTTRDKKRSHEQER